ncbi:hypothetical protein B0H13DRAFT_1891619 [Mycena leptocephala]|nr:hypothetical protein B0H13DRAFT_1891619 [Mycena leptocephala]
MDIIPRRVPIIERGSLQPNRPDCGLVKGTTVENIDLSSDSECHLERMTSCRNLPFPLLFLLTCIHNNWQFRLGSYKAGEIPANITRDDEFVGEVYRTVEACKVFLFFPIYWLCYSQIDGNLGTVAAGMRLNDTPNDFDQESRPNLDCDHDPNIRTVPLPVSAQAGNQLQSHQAYHSGISCGCTSSFMAFTAMVHSTVLEKYLYDRSRAIMTSHRHVQACEPIRMAFRVFRNYCDRFCGLFYWTFRDLDRRETELNLIGTGERDGFVGEMPMDEPEKAA